MNNKRYQVIVVGGGLAGLTAGLYCARSMLDCLLIEKGIIGGKIINAEQVENYPGFPGGISGTRLAQLVHEQAASYGLESLPAEVTSLVPGDRQNLVNTSEGDLITEVVIIASGSRFRKLGVRGEDDLIGKGVSYCATCDGPLFKDKAVAVIGGGNAAITEALQLSKFASRVSVIHRRNQLAASKILIEKTKASPNIDFIWDTAVAEVEGKGTVEQLRLKNTKNATISTLRISGVFVAVGLEPDTGYLQGILPLDKEGYVITNELMETGVPGILAAGDVRHNSVRQAITAAGDGATAAVSAERFLGRLGHY